MVTLTTTSSDAACTERDPSSLHDAWSELAARRSSPCIFLTPEWIAVARAHDPAKPITLAVGAPAFGVAALAHDADGTLRFAGGELTDEQDVVAPAGTEAAVARAVATWIGQSGPPRVDLSFVPEDAPTLPAVAEALSARGYRVTRERLVTSPRVELPKDFERHVASLGKKERHELRRKIRRLEASGAVSFRFATERERPAALDRFIALHRRSRGDKAEFMTPQNEAFFRDIADALAPLGRLRLAILSLRDADAAVLFAFAYGDTMALYNAAYDPGLASLSIGIVSHAWAIREAIAEGFRVYDLLRGSEPYKYDLGAKDRWLGRLVAVRP